MRRSRFPPTRFSASSEHRRRLHLGFSSSLNINDPPTFTESASAVSLSAGRAAASNHALLGDAWDRLIGIKKSRWYDSSLQLKQGEADEL